MTGTRISDMAHLASLPASGARFPVIKDGDTANYNYDLASDLAGKIRHVSDRAALALLDHTIGLTAYLRESGREGTFVFSTANNAANVTADPQQGVYVAPSSDTTGASGAWVRKYVGPVYLEWFGGGTSAADTANTAAWNAIVSLLPNCEVKLNRGTYSMTLMAFPSNGSNAIKCVGAGRETTTILITGDGGGAPSAGANGGVQMFGACCTLSDVWVRYNNPSLQCLLNISAVSQAGRITVQRVDLAPSALTASQVQATAIYMANCNTVIIDNCFIGGSPNFKKNMVIRGFWSSCSVRDCTFRPHALDTANGVYCTENFHIDILSSTQSAQIYNNTFEQGPNGIKCLGQGQLTIRDNYFADSAGAVGYWLPSKAYSIGGAIYPSASITGDSTVGTTINNASATTSLYVGQSVTVIGAGAAGANVATRITAISGSTLTVANAMSAAVAGTGIYFGAYAQHIYVASVAGTTGSSPPTFPTTASATVVDGTATWRELNSGAWVDGNDNTGGSVSCKDALTISGGIMFSNPVGILVRKSTGGSIPGAVLVTGVSFNGNNIHAKLDGCLSAIVQGCKVKGYTDAGIIIAAETSGMRDFFAVGNNDGGFATAADFVASTNSTSLSGIHMGTTSLTGIAAARIFNFNTSPIASPGLSMLGAVLSSNPTGGMGYMAGAGGSISQATNKGAGVTKNTVCGQITMHSAALAGATAVSFTFTNSTIGADDRLAVWVKSGFATAATYSVRAEGNAAGSRTIILKNESAGSLSESVVLGFDVTKAVIA